jgi:hypothetical protein
VNGDGARNIYVIVFQVPRQPSLLRRGFLCEVPSIDGPAPRLGRQDLLPLNLAASWPETGSMLGAGFEVWFKRYVVLVHRDQAAFLILAFRILFGRPRIYELFPTRIPNVLVFPRALSPIKDLLGNINSSLFDKAAERAMSFYTHGMDVVSWPTSIILRPSTAYFASIPISLPFISLTQLV